MDDKEKIKNCCLEKEVAPCVSACPFHFDVREFISRVRRGNFNLAYRLYSNAVGFPCVVSELCGEECACVCPRKHIDGSIGLRMIELAAVAYASNKRPNDYNLPKKNKKIAVIGAGISGLACALRLANKKYDVTVLEKSGRIGGNLWNKLSPDIFLKEIKLQFENEEYELLLNQEVTDIDKITARYDAVYIATGCKGTDFGLIPGDVGNGPVMGTVKGVYLGGEMLGGDTVKAVAEGLETATLIEGYIKTENMQKPHKYLPTRIKLNLAGLKRKERIVSANGLYTKEEASAEAWRCIECRCDFCMHSCDMMEYFKKTPKMIEEEVHATIFPGSIDGNGTMATRLISTCSQCGLCKEACPEDIDVGMFLRQSHIAMKKKDAMPWVYHKFWLRDMEFADSGRASFVYAPDTKRHRFVFFPGCQVGGSDPDYVIKPYEFLLEKSPDTALMLMCCGAPALWAGDEPLYKKSCEKITAEWEKLGRPVFIFACPTCMKLFREYMPEIKDVMLVDRLAELGIDVPEANDSCLVSVFDPCSCRDLTSTHKNVRELVKKAGYSIEPLGHEGKDAHCCSWGGQISIANPPYSQWIVKKRISEGKHPYVVYCSNCRDIFAGEGKPVRHILDLLFKLRGWNALPPTFSERRRNREYLKKKLALELAGDRSCETMKPKLIMDVETAAKLNKTKILEDDVLDVISFCEMTGRKLIDEYTGHFTGYAEIEHMTFWVEYALDGDDFRLFNAYGHRMKIELEEVWNGRKQVKDEMR